MPVTHTPHLKIGALIAACEEGYRVGRKGNIAQLPKRYWNSDRLGRAFWAGYDNARRYEGAMDGPAR